ncbi:putative autophagy protein 4 [Corchorus olitorius]|uniref:Autophagy protein 4 n=1 Tax=Corchorus olitorius TaxID=93759 RepID=A0A1R3JSG6_9ROSI|nr:putative autophagy protein 4 [Corchorus olitorius]
MEGLGCIENHFHSNPGVPSISTPANKSLLHEQLMESAARE